MLGVLARCLNLFTSHTNPDSRAMSLFDVIIINMIQKLYEERGKRPSESDYADYQDRRTTALRHVLHTLNFGASVSVPASVAYYKEEV